MPNNASETVSVVIPAFNATETVARTLESVCAQSHERMDIVVVDDGSTDATADVVRGLARLDPRIRLVSSNVNRGVAAARNLGLAHTDTTWVAPCDSDDLWHRDKIALQLALARASSDEVAGIYCWSDGIDEHDRVVFPGWARSTVEGAVHHEMIVDSLPGSGSAPLLRRACIDDLGGFPEAFSGADEWHLYIALAARWEWRVVPRVLVGYRMRSGSISAGHHAMEDRLARTTAWILRTWPDLPETVLARRAYMVNRYLSFLALRAGDLGQAVRYRVRAWRAAPGEALAMDSLGFLLLLAARLIGVRRYYFDAWRRPRLWRPAGSETDA